MKQYYIQHNIGKARHVVNYYDGEAPHLDGSPFYRATICSNKRDLARVIAELKRAGYKEQQDREDFNEDGNTPKKISFNLRRSCGELLTTYACLLSIPGNPSEYQFVIHRSIGIDPGYSVSEYSTGLCVASSGKYSSALGRKIKNTKLDVEIAFVLWLRAFDMETLRQRVKYNLELYGPANT